MIMRAARGERRRGATVVESAFVLGIFFLLLFGIFEYGRLLFMRHVLQNAAREGARFAVVHTYDKSTADVQARVTQYLASQGYQITGLTVTVFEADVNGNNVGPWTDASFGEGVGVRITGSYHPGITTLLHLNSAYSMTTQCTMNCEAN
jgi:Flp pilus assembly protein TadG